MTKKQEPSAARNKSPILQVLQRALPESGHLLEIASGSGEHVATYAAAMPRWTFSPTDRDPAALASIDEWVSDAGVANVAPAAELDAAAWPWPVTSADAVLACNMIHISPWESTVGLLEGCAKVLPASGLLVLYGPYVINGVTAESNLKFSERLQAKDSKHGVRELRDVEELAGKSHLSLQEVVPMPANNHCVIFRKVPATPPSS